jgi:putative tricarboxylic transport membrane protein
VRRADLVVGGALAVLAVAYVVGAARLPTNVATRTDLGPNVYPLALGGGLLVAVAVLVIGAVVRRPATSAGQPTASMEPTATHTAWRRLLVVLAATGVYVWLLGMVGFILASTVYLAFCARLIDDQGRYRGVRGAAVPVAYGLLTSVVIYVLFDRLLGVLLPPGLLFPALAG